MNRPNTRKRETCKMAALAAIAALVFIGPAQGFEQPILGGPGGGFFRVVCPAGEFLRGLQGRVGDVLDNMQLLCAKFQTEPNILTPPRKNWTVLLPVHILNGPDQTIGQSSGGVDLRSECTNHNFVRRVEFNTKLFDGDHLIAGIRMTCDHGTIAGFDEPDFGQFPFGTGPQKQFCPEGFWATGFIGRRGFRVDAIGLVCAEMPPL